MSNKVSPSAQWLVNEDREGFQGRLDRLEWLMSQTPQGEFWRFHGGLLTKQLFEECRYCFVYSQFLAAILLGLAYVERTFAALSYAHGGRDELERAGIAELAREALNNGWIIQTEFDELEKGWQLRNSVAHFRRPGHDSSLEYRSVADNELPDAILEDDARRVLKTVFRILSKNLW